MRVRRSLENVEREAIRGREASTPLVLLGGVALVVGVVVAVVTAIAVVLWIYA